MHGVIMILSIPACKALGIVPAIFAIPGSSAIVTSISAQALP